MPRIKRAAAAAAETKIKRVVEEVFNRDDDSLSKSSRENREEHSQKNKNIKRDQNRDDGAPKVKKLRPLCDKGNAPFRYGVATAVSTCFDSQSTVSSKTSGSSCFDHLFTTSTSSSLNREGIELTSTEKQHLYHQEQRARRSINSVGPMNLSRRSFFRMSLDRSPLRSPIRAHQLRFTPVAHLRTTPIFVASDRRCRS